MGNIWDISELSSGTLDVVGITHRIVRAQHLRETGKQIRDRALRHV
jgi:hypothetical protein